MIEAGNGGSIIITSSTGGVKGLPGIGAHYVAAKHGVVGLMRTLANELVPHFIRVNTVHPTGVNTPMIANDAAMQAVSAAAELVNMHDSHRRSAPGSTGGADTRPPSARSPTTPGHAL
jgi:NAD(P)-dependent dehydrogenase (short-subunit alcohol dehydrogenase family)